MGTKGRRAREKEASNFFQLISCILAPPGVWDDDIRHLEESGARVNYPTPEQAARALANLAKYRSMQFDPKINTKG